jgi:ribose/xylose/arabinose/galactoside ABC-type transport system permease subunit
LSWRSSRPIFFRIDFYVVLHSVWVGILVAFAQMVVLGAGQMNLSVGALGGMTAIPFSGMMEVFIEVFELPLWLAVPIAIAIGVLGFALNGLLPAQHRHQRLHYHAIRMDEVVTSSSYGMYST